MSPDGRDVAAESEPVIRKPLFFGIVGATALFVLGLVFLFATAPPTDASTSYSLEGIIQSIRSLDPAGIIGLGIIIVIATPIARMIVATAYFSRRDRTLALLSLTSIALITAGFLISILR